MVILRTRNKITDFFMILAWASPFNLMSHRIELLGYIYLIYSVTRTLLLDHTRAVLIIVKEPGGFYLCF